MEEKKSNDWHIFNLVELIDNVLLSYFKGEDMDKDDMTVILGTVYTNYVVDFCSGFNVPLDIFMKIAKETKEELG